MKTRVVISIDKKLLDKINRLIQRGIFANRNEVIQNAVEEKLLKISKSRLAIESAKLSKQEEQSLAEEGLG